MKQTLQFIKFWVVLGVSLSIFVGIVIGSIISLHLIDDDTAHVDHKGFRHKAHHHQYSSNNILLSHQSGDRRILRSDHDPPSPKRPKMFDLQLNPIAAEEDNKRNDLRQKLNGFGKLRRVSNQEESVSDSSKRFPLSQQIVQNATLIRNEAAAGLQHVLAALLNATRNMTNERIDLRDAHAMYLNISCSFEESLEADTIIPTSDCSLLQQEFGLCHAFKAKRPDLRTFEDLDAVKTPYAQGYITVPGLEDPVTVAAALYDEYYCIDKGDPIKFPIGTMAHAFVDGDGRMRAAQPFVFDLVYTEVDFMEPSFQGDRKLYKLNVPRPLPKIDMRPAAIRKRKVAKARMFTKAKALLPHVWGKLTNGPLGADLSVLADETTSLNQNNALSHFDFRHTNNLLRNLTTRHANANLAFKAKGLPQLNETTEKDNVSHKRLDDPYRHLPRVLYAEFSGNTDNVRRFRNFNELRYSLRSVYRYIVKPMEEAAAVRRSKGENITTSFGHVYVVLSHRAQAPSWLKEDPRIILVEQRELFPNPARSLPNFQSQAIESVLHRIKGLHRHFIALNNDFMLARQVSFFDYFQPHVVWTPPTDKVNPKTVNATLPTDFASSSGVPTVRWLPIIHTTDMYFTHPKSGRWKDFFSPASLNMINFVGNMIGPDPLGFIFDDTHIPQMYDKLQFMRMLIEPTLRERLCFTRGSRERKLMGTPPFHSYPHFTMLWRHGWGPDATRRATFELFPELYEKYPTTQTGPLIPFEDSLGRRRTVLWSYLKALYDGNASQHLTPLKFLFEHLPKLMYSGKRKVLPLPDNMTASLAPPASTTSDASLITRAVEVKSNNKPPFGSHVAVYDHWIFDYYRMLRQPVLLLTTSQKVFFGMGENVAKISEHIHTIQKYKGKMLFVTENDDLPGGSRLPSPSGIFGQMSAMSITEICAWPKDVWVSATCSSSTLTIDTKDAYSNPSLLQEQRIGIQTSKVLSDQRIMEILFDEATVKKKSPSGMSLPIDKDEDRAEATPRHYCELIGERIMVACATDAAYSSIVALEIASGLYEEETTSKIADGLRDAGTQPHCAVGARYRSPHHYKHMRASYFIQNYSSSQRHHRSGFVARHNCSLVALPDSEVPPSHDVYAADLFLEAIRTAAGDCDVSDFSSRAAPWELKGC